MKETKILKGSSETICETTFNFDDYKPVMPEHKNKIDKEFLIYLIGFFEGDGSLLMNYQRKSIEFTLDQHSRDFAFLNNLRKSLGYGRVFKYGSMGRLYIGNEENLLRIIHLLNGNLCIPARREQFRNFLVMYNEKYKRKILFKNYGPKVSLDTAWLSGFTDAEGCFMLDIHRKRNGNVSCQARFSITQKTEPIIEDISNLFNTSKNTSKNTRLDKSWNGYEFYVGNRKSRMELIRYFQRYKLKTKKRIAFLTWRNAHDLMVKKVHLTMEGYKTLEGLVKKVKKLKIESDLVRDDKSVPPNG
jgi:hypothetical protein